METRVMIIGNPGVGKSALCNSLGARFASGFSIGKGFTEKAQLCSVTINSEKFDLVDVPGLYEGNQEKNNAKCSRNKERNVQTGCGVRNNIRYSVRGREGTSSRHVYDEGGNKGNSCRR